MFNIERGGAEHRKLSYSDKYCVSCGICTEVCPTSSLRLGPIVPIARGLIEMDPISVNQDSCVFCGLCSVACPFDALSLYVDGTELKDLGNYPVWVSLFFLLLPVTDKNFKSLIDIPRPKSSIVISHSIVCSSLFLVIFSILTLIGYRFTAL